MQNQKKLLLLNFFQKKIMNRILIIDYGSGNIRSVFNAVKKVSSKKISEIKVSSSINDIKKCTHIILPGVGAFEFCLNGLKRKKLLGCLEEVVLENKRPFLGICVGMQMLATKGYENGEFSGLNWINGEVRKINTGKTKLKIPHMGWNNLHFKRKTNFIKKLLKKIKFDKNKEVSAYFVHSYNFKNKNENEKIITTDYGNEITAMVSRENIIGTQFHPEKSHYFGLAFLQTFIEQKY